MEYVIQAVLPEQKQWKSSYGKDMITYTLKIDGEMDPVELNQQASSPAPEPGPISGNIEQGSYGKKFKKEYNPGGFTPAARSSGSPVDTSPVSKPAYKDNSDGQRQGMCINNAAAYINTNAGAGLGPDTWATTVHAFATALYQLGDLKPASSAQEAPKSPLDNIFPDSEPVPEPPVGELPWTGR